jgi:hypothetical protein
VDALNQVSLKEKNKPMTQARGKSKETNKDVSQNWGGILGLNCTY